VLVSGQMRTAAHCNATFAQHVIAANPGFHFEIYACLTADADDDGTLRGGDRAGVAAACGNLGNCYHSTGEYGRARELYGQDRAICEALGDRAGVTTACGNLGNCCLNTGDYGRAISRFTEQYQLAKGVQVVQDQAKAALGMGVALRLEVRANVRGRAARATELPGPPASASACGDDGVREAEKSLQAALDLGCTAARLHLAQLAFDAGPEDSALAHLQNRLGQLYQQIVL